MTIKLSLLRTGCIAWSSLDRISGNKSNKAMIANENELKWYDKTLAPRRRNRKQNLIVGDGTGLDWIELSTLNFEPSLMPPK